MTSPIVLTSANVGSKIAFQSKNTKDAVVYEGICAAICDYNLAATFGDLTAYNATVQQSDPTVGAVNTLNWFIISLINGSGQTQSYAFAQEWISPGTFSIIQDKIIVHIDVYDSPTGNHQLILNLLLANNYTAFITGVTS